LEQNPDITLLSAGQPAVIKSFSNHQLAAKLMAMGILPGTEIVMIRKSPFGGAYYIKAKNHLVALRKIEAFSIKLFRLSENSEN
jgi:ferrous iron transport protein A